MLEKLRAKSDKAKNVISLAFTIVIFAGIIFVWVSSWDAQKRETETREKTVSPVAGVMAMFEGLVANVKDAISGTPSFVESGAKPATPKTKSGEGKVGADGFDLSGVVIVDTALGTTTAH